MSGNPNKLNNSNRPKKDSGGSKGSNNIYWVYAVILLFILFATFLLNPGEAGRPMTPLKFQDSLVANNLVKEVTILTSDNTQEVEVTLTQDAVEDYNQKYPKQKFTSGPHYSFTISGSNEIEKYLTEEKIPFTVKEKPQYGMILQFLIPVGLIVLIWIIFMRRLGAGGPGGQIFNIGKSKASLYDKENKVHVTFDDVAGLEGAKEEVMEVVEFLKNPSKFTKLGGHIPKGVLLVGPPGTGKTLLAKAVAGEAKVPFFSLSGSDFVEMFVGVGAARVRDLFKQAKEKAPCIVFIDEIDAVGRSRGKSNFTGGNDERENTLNQLLVEMDGFNSDTGVILMAATNRPDVLDSALMRPGRFDRQIGIDRPDLKGREQIFDVHLKKIKTSDEVNPAKLASQTPGFVGADIANICNEAALIAARRNKEAVEMDDFQDAIDRVIGGLEKKNKIISPEEKRIIAYHEAGHAVAGWFLKHTHPLVKVSIVPRGLAALGYAQYLPKEQYFFTKEQLLDQMCMTLGGRAAEEIIFGKVSTGAQNDLERVTNKAYAMVTIYGLNEKVGNISFNPDNQDYNFTKPYSEKTASLIDEEVRILIQSAYERTLELLRSKLNELEIIAQELLKKEVIFKDDLVNLIGERPFQEKQVEDVSAEEVETEEETAENEATPEVNGQDKPTGEETPEKEDQEDEPTSEKVEFSSNDSPDHLNGLG